MVKKCIRGGICHAIHRYAKTYSYRKDNNKEHEKSKGTKKCFIKRKTKLQHYKNCLEWARIENIINNLEKNCCR